ncbi:hypothetical protein [Actinokineospora sp. NPDC004072]
MGSGAASGPWVLLVVLVVVIGLVALVLLAQRADPDRAERAEQRRKALAEPLPRTSAAVPDDKTRPRLGRPDQRQDDR